MDIDKNTGKGFLFKNHDAQGLLWAIKEAIHFYNLSPELKSQQTERIMAQSAANFKPEIMTSQYIQLYEKILESPLFTEYKRERTIMSELTLVEKIKKMFADNSGNGSMYVNGKCHSCREKTVIEIVQTSGGFGISGGTIQETNQDRLNVFCIDCCSILKPYSKW